jgi:hypothetical protein
VKIQHQSKTSWTIPGVGETDEHGVIDVPDDVAGTPPDPRVETLMVEHRAAVEANDHEGARQLKEEIIGLDKGSGLLAQAAWQPYGQKAKAAVKQEADK